ncbi:hypothetical protein SORBI_3009G036366 [Sorghum bicolor]|uniref:Uncharacterized protein n=1 Tax=Sorghum bicolor TaxID=4558 RepID=A0A1Z5R0V3_SORBI|nr:hypothetical protein SORBI_3009G036366 [Sorghum bicolor]
MPSAAWCGCALLASIRKQLPSCVRTEESPRLTETDNGGWRVDHRRLETWIEGGSAEALSW